MVSLGPFLTLSVPIAPSDINEVEDLENSEVSTTVFNVATGLLGALIANDGDCVISGEGNGGCDTRPWFSSFECTTWTRSATARFLACSSTRSLPVSLVLSRP